MSSIDQRHAFIGVLKTFDVAMLATRGGPLHARPMAVADVTNDGVVVFATSLESPKIAEIETDPRGFVTFQGGGRYISANGVIRVDRSRTEIERLWSESWRIWFPEGKTDPSICLLRLELFAGEYWDMGGTKGVKYLFESAKAFLSGRTPVIDPTQHAWVDL